MEDWMRFNPGVSKPQHSGDGVVSRYRPDAATSRDRQYERITLSPCHGSDGVLADGYDSVGLRNGIVTTPFNSHAGVSKHVC